mmetsp:Transcript_6545/g.11381  ORF Transcript_6545/g.11381 Transcript_6545/m.11381 type:complete len:131 (+) Transcript_6545:1027-1419(+)
MPFNAFNLENEDFTDGRKHRRRKLEENEDASIPALEYFLSWTSKQASNLPSLIVVGRSHSPSLPRNSITTFNTYRWDTVSCPVRKRLQDNKSLSMHRRIIYRTMPCMLDSMPSHSYLHIRLLFEDLPMAS